METIQAEDYYVVTPIVFTSSHNDHEIESNISSEAIHVGDKVMSVR